MDNEMANPMATEGTPQTLPSPKSAGSGNATAGSRQYSGLTVLEVEEDFISTNVPLSGRVEEEGHGYFHWEIDNWTQLPDRVISKTFTVAGHDWDILLFPRGNGVNDTVSLYVEYKPKDAGEDWHVCAMFGLAMSNAEDPTLFKNSVSHHRFTAEESDWGFTRFVELRHVMTPDADSRALLEKGRVRISAFLRVIKDPLGVLWHNFHNYNSRKHTGFVGLRNQGATCYMNSLLQSLYFTTEFRNAVYQIPTENDDPKRSVALALQRVFYNLQDSDEAVDTTELTKSFGWDSLESFMQHDVQEFNRVLQDNLETKMKGTVVDGAMARLFEGKMKSYIRCVNVDYESSRVENYYDISLNVKGCATLRDSFANYCEVEMLDGENKYQAEGFGLQDARKGVIFESFPPVLQLQLKRFEYDFQRDAMVKINDRHEFPPTIDLGEFLADDADRSQPWTYALHGVLVHSGDLHGGHYFGLLRPTAEDRWYRFDDDRVVPVARDEVFEEYYGGEFPQPAQPATAVPGMRTRPNSKRFTNAYMLVYIRESLRDKVLGGEAAAPAHLLRRVQEDRAEEARRQREKAELAHTLAVKVVSDKQFAQHQSFDLSYFDQRQPASNPLFEERMPRDMTVRDFAAHYAERTGCALGSFRLWTMVGRVNKTVRCEVPLVGAALDMTLAQVLESRMPRWTDMRLYCETCPEDGPEDFLDEKPPLRTNLIHAKFFDPETFTMRGLGSLYARNTQMVQEIMPKLRAMAGLPPDTPIVLYEEVKPSLIEPIVLTLNFRQAEIQTGDIICFQIEPSDTSVPRVPDFFDSVQHRISVSFVPHPTRADDERTASGASSPDAEPLTITTSSKTPYDNVAQLVADHLGMSDPLKLRFYTVSPTGQPRQPVRRTPTTTLAEMLPSAMFMQPSLNNKGLHEYTVMYERLEVDIVQIENMRTIRVTFVGRTMRDEHQLEVLVPKDSSAQALMEATYSKIEQLLRTQQRSAAGGSAVPPKPFSLRFYVVGYHRVLFELNGSEHMNLGTPGVSDVVAELCTSDDTTAEDAMMDTAEDRPSKNVEVFHFYRDLSHAHSVPFLFPIYQNEPWRDTWTRLQRRLGMGEKELKNLGVVCGPVGATELRRCRVVQGTVSTDRSDSPAMDQNITPSATPPPPSAASLSAGDVEMEGSRAASAVSSDNNSSPATTADDSVCLWDLLEQQQQRENELAEQRIESKDEEDQKKGLDVAGFIGLHHVDRASRHRNLHHERAIRILN
ncbi:ubiquitin-specific protease ubp15 [Coemansia sp. RSA 989]|nr:ubiquitin-specific protease ubp15 [Coemansia sp. RSA 1086]KAJ1866497.1 ubiquitin-specific protease ubp15 [Coemansia sp. RSA 989]